MIELFQHRDIVKKAVDIKSQCVKLRSKTVFDNAAKRAQARDDKRKEQRAILLEQLKQRQTYRINTSDIDDEAIEATDSQVEEEEAQLSWERVSDESDSDNDSESSDEDDTDNE